MIKRLLLFLLINFGALALGGFFTGTGVSSDWYNELNKAPWTPPGWVFGAAWTFIMICFSFFLALLWPKVKNLQKLIGLFVLQFVLNVGWNPVFFYFQQVELGMVIISALTILIGYILFHHRKDLKGKSALLLPYFIWLLIATSLNGYILWGN